MMASAAVNGYTIHAVRPGAREADGELTLPVAQDLMEGRWGGGGGRGLYVA